PGGYVFFLVTDAMFGTSDFAKVDKFIKKNGHIEGIIKMPEALFKSEQARKSILILQKADVDVKPPEEVLLANLSSLTDPSVTAPILAEIENWLKRKR
uniref:N-6 DNA methylase n=1 Tax=Listeria monocytogenes TaxID=1639 RepID=UPI0034A19F6E